MRIRHHCHALSPEFVHTAMTDEMSQALVDELDARTLRKRPAEPAEIASAVRRPAADAASYVTGAEIVVGSGLSLGA